MNQLPDPRNADILVWVGDGLKPRAEAKVSVFDSAVQGGDAVWEGLRVYDGRIAELDAHLDRLADSAKAMAFETVPGRDEIKAAIFATLQANGMRDDVHARLTLTRGEKLTSGMNPRNNRCGPCLIVLAEWKPPVYGSRALRLISSSVRRNSPQCLDSKIHHNNLINNILACIEANAAGADGAVMLDLNGFVAETNDTNVFIVKRERLVTPTADSCLPGITRRMVIEIAREESIPLDERNVSLTEVYAADEMFTTGTMGELAPVAGVDGRAIGNGEAGPLTRRLQELHRRRARERGEPLPF
ncbi:MAG: aminotransferase class IV [Gammaproteobacteria bacterium]